MEGRALLAPTGGRAGVLTQKQPRWPGEQEYSPFLVVGERVVGGKSSVGPRLPPAREGLLLGGATFGDLRLPRRRLS